uniref:Cytokine like 1 n=1 Tax=Erpetoichthys calabaricus TaxID=27687 RepID=A0A8C4RRK6_ERPCA
MNLCVVFAVICSLVLLASSAPNTCYSRVLGLSKAIQGSLVRYKRFQRTVSNAYTFYTVYVSVIAWKRCQEFAKILTLWYFSLQRPCLELLPTMYFDVHNSCLLPKLRDFLYILETLTYPDCKKLPKVKILTNRVRSLFDIINKMCYRDIEHYTDDCDALETGEITYRPGLDQLQLYQER